MACRIATGTASLLLLVVCVGGLAGAAEASGDSLDSVPVCTTSGENFDEDAILASVDPEVWEQLRDEPRVLLVVALRGSAPTPIDLPHTPPRRQRSLDIAERQQHVLTLLGDDFELRHRYRNIYGFTGLGGAHHVALLEQHPDVSRVGVDRRGSIALNQTAPFIGAPAATSNYGVTGDGITVAVLDTGIDSDNPDLEDDIAPGAWHFLAAGNDQGAGAEDDQGHGTHMSGIVTSSNAPFLGVAPDARVLPIKVVDALGNGFLSDWVAGADYVVSVHQSQYPVQVMNFSLSSTLALVDCPCDNFDTLAMLFQSALSTAQSAGIVTFSSTANGAECNGMGAPGCLSASAAVAAVYTDNTPLAFDVCTDTDAAPDQVACFSNRSACNDLAAPGVLVTSSRLGGGTLSISGTSPATPHASALAALMLQRANDLGVTLPPGTLLQIIRDTAVTTTDPCLAAPPPLRIDALAAVAEVGCANNVVDNFVCNAGCNQGEVLFSWDVLVAQEIALRIFEGNALVFEEFLSGVTTDYSLPTILPAADYSAELEVFCGANTVTASCSFTQLDCAADFVRGDFNGDGVFNALVDSLGILNFTFLGGTPPICAEAADANDDGQVTGLIEALFMLSCGFVPQSPCMNSPYPACGVDPAPTSTLGCNFTSCP